MRSLFAPAQKYIGTGVVAQYTFDFKVEQLSQLLIVMINNLGVEILRVRGDNPGNYVTSITFDPENGAGTVNLTTSLATDWEIHLFQANDAPTQPSEFRDKLSFTLRSFERAMDFITGAIQRSSWMAQRSIRLHDSYGNVFNMQLPRVLIPTASIIVGADGLSLFLGPTIAQLAQASADAVTANNAATAAGNAAANSAMSAAAALVSANAAAASATAAAGSATGSAASLAAANAALAAALTAQAAAEAAYAQAVITVAGALGFVSVGPFTVNAGANQDLAGQTINSATYRQVDFIVVIKGLTDTNLRSRIEFSFVWTGSAWVKLDGPERHFNTISAVDFTVSNAGTGQLRATNNGVDNVQFIIQKVFHAS